MFLLGVFSSMAGTALPDVPSVAPSEAVTATSSVRGFGAVLIPDEGDNVYGGGLSLEVPLLGQTLYGELGVSLFENDVYKTDLNLLVYVPVAQQFLVYGMGGVGYNSESEDWNVGVGGGVKYHLGGISLFSDAVYNVSDDAYDGNVTVRVGLGFEF